MQSFLLTWLLVVALMVHLLPISNGNQQPQDVRLVAEWHVLEYEFPNDTERQRALEAGEYIIDTGVPIDMDIDYAATNGEPRIFVTVPRFVTGVPITLGTLTNVTATGGPRIRGYPNYDWNRTNGSSNCDGLTSVFRVQIDGCGRLWVLDSGRVGDTHYCPPQVVVIDLATDQMVRQYKFPVDQFIANISQLNAFVIDVHHQSTADDNCLNYRAYIADVVAFGLMVYDYSTNTSWRVLSKWLYSTPLFGTYTIAGESFDLMDGIFTLALGPRIDEPGERLMYWHSLASTWENSVAVSVLDNATLWPADATILTSARSFRMVGDRGCQATAEVADNNGNILMGLVNPIGIACWDTQRPYARDTVRMVWQNDTTLQFPSGLKVKRNPSTGDDELWTFTIRVQKFYANSYSPDEVNFRIQVVDVSQLLDGSTRCSSKVGSALPDGDLVGAE